MKIKFDKKRIIPIASVVAVLLITAACIFGGIQLLKQFELEKEKREKNSVAAIMDVFHDQANEYITPDEPTEKEDITLRIRTVRYNVTKAQIQYTTDKGASWKTVDMKFEKHDDTGHFDFFKGKIPAQSETVHYRFICSNKKNTVYVDTNLLPEKAEMGNYETCFMVKPGFSTPDWAKGAMWYSLMPDAFYNGDTSNDLSVSDTNQINSWNNVHIGLSDKYGGDLAGVTAKTDYFKELGVDGVYMNPVFRSSQNAGYGPVDFMQIEPSLGNEEAFRKMCDTLHDNDLKVMMDAVLTFTTTDSIYFDSKNRFPLNGAYESQEGEFADLFAYHAWPDGYLTTWGGAALDHSEESVQKLLYSEENSFMQHYTAAPYSVDGWRFDCGGWLWGSTEDGNVGADVVMGDIREYLKSVNSDVVLISENDTKNLNTGVWDGQWNLNMIEVFERYASGITNEASLKDSLRKTINQYPRALALCLTNMRSQHDKSRVTVPNANNEKAAILVQLTYIGSPSIYYGEEIGLNRTKGAGIGASNSFYAMEWDENNWDYEKYNLYRAIGELRTKYDAVKTGAFKDLLTDTENNIYAFGRWNDDGTVITVASQNKDTVQVELNARSLSVADDTIFTDWFTGKQYTVNEDGKLLVDVIPGGSIFVKGKTASKYVNAEKENTETVLVNFDDFEKDTKEIMFSAEQDKKVSRKDGKLVLNAKKDMITQTTNGKTDDWTFKAQLDSNMKEDAYAGVICMTDANHFVAAGRTTINGKAVLFIGRTTDGTVLVDKYVEDTKPENPVVIQLQRIGTTYSAVYSYDDEKYSSIGDSVFANYSSEKVGVFAAYTENAAFDYVSFGDSIHDGKSVNTPYADGVIDLNYSTTITAQADESMKILSGEWKYAEEGYYQSNQKDKSQLSVDNKNYDDVRVNVTLKLEKGSGYAGVGFGKDTFDSDENDGFFLKYTKDHKLVLTKDGKKVADVTAKSKKGEALRLVLETEGDTIRVYAGQNASRIMNLENTGYENGYICFYTSDMAARFMNYRFTSMESEWNQLSGDSTVYGGLNVITCSGTTSNSADAYGAITRTGVAVTDFAVTAELEIGTKADEKGSVVEGGVLLSASEGKSKNSDGVSVSLMEEGVLSLKSNGREVANYSLGEATTKADILFVRKDKICKVWVMGIADPVITWEDDTERGGVFQLYAVNNNTRFAKLALEDIHDIAENESILVQLWKAGKMTVPVATTYMEDFEHPDAWNNLVTLYPWHGDWAINEGVLSCVNARGYVASTALHNRIYKDFQMTFKYRFDESDGSGWAHIILRKPTVNSTHSGMNYSVLLSLDGTVSLFNGKETVAKGKVENFKVDNWYELKIVCKGSQIQVFNGSSQLLSYTDSGYGTTYTEEGFISFDSNQTRYSIDDVIIQPLG